MEVDFLSALTATGVGSLPHQDLPRAINHLVNILLGTPFRIQLSKFRLLENMVLEVSPNLLLLNIGREKGIHVDRVQISLGS